MIGICKYFTNIISAFNNRNLRLSYLYNMLHIEDLDHLRLLIWPEKHDLEQLL